MTIAGVLAASLFAAPGVPAASAAVTSTPVLAVDAGDSICAIRMDATIGCWANDEFGETNPPAGTFLAVSAGQHHICAIRTDGTLACWGGEEGPEPLPSGTFTAVSAGWDACAIRTDQTVACWPAIDGPEAESAPAGKFTAVAVSEFGYHCAIGTDQTITCWAADGAVVGAPAGTFTAVSAGSEHLCAIRASDATLVCWGGNEFGQATPPAGTFSAVGAGYDHTCAIRTSGTLVCWGANDVGQATPPGGTFTAVTASWGSCAIATDGTLACWAGAPFPYAYITAPAFPTTTAFLLRWSGRAAVAPVTSYDVRYRRSSWYGAFGSWVRWRTGTTQTSATFTGSPGYTYCFAVQGHDADGAVSGWSQQVFEMCSVIPLDDRSLARVGNWTALTDARFYRSTGLRSFTYGAKLRRTGVTAVSIKLLATSCPLCGKVNVYWNSTLLKTISLYSARRVDRVAFRVKSFDSDHTGTLTIKVVSSGKKVIIDGLAIVRVPG